MSLGSALKKVDTSLKSTKIPTTSDDFREVWELYCLGNSFKELAKVYQTTPSIVRSWIDTYRSTYAAEMSRTQRSMLLTDSLAFFRTLRDLSMSEVRKIQTTTLSVDEDGEIVDAEGTPDPKLMAARARLMKVALDSEKQAADLLVRTGILPSAAKDINVSIIDAQSEEGRTKVLEDDATRSEKEILGSIEKFLTHSTKLLDEDEPSDEVIEADYEVKEETEKDA